MADWSETWLQAKKQMETYRASCTLEQYEPAADAAEQLRTLSTDLLLWAVKKRRERSGGA